MRRFLALLSLALGLSLPADAQLFFGPNAGGFGPQATGSAGAFAIQSVSLSTTGFTIGTPYAGTLTVTLKGGTLTGNTTTALSTSSACSGQGADNASFTLTGYSLAGPSTGGPYAICILVTAPGAGNSPVGQTFTITGTSLDTITGIALSDTTFPMGAATGTTVGTATVSVSGGSFAGTFSLSTSAGGCDGTNGANNGSFSINSSTGVLQTSGTVNPGSYAVCVLATDGTFSNSPYGQAFTIVSGGIADVLGSTPAHYWGIRAVSYAEANAATAKMMNVLNTGTGNACDVLVGTNGGIGVTATGCADGVGTAFATWLGASTGHVVTLYDRGGGTAWNLTQGTDANRPTIVATPTGVVFNGTSQGLGAGSATAIGNPQTWIGAIRPSSNSSTGGVLLLHTDVGTTQWTGRDMFWYGGGTNALNVSAAEDVTNSFGEAFKGTITLNTYGAIAGLFTSATSRTAYLTASAGTANATNLTPTTENYVEMGYASWTGHAANNFYGGSIAEWAIITSGLSGANITAVCHNQYRYGWSATSC